MDANTPLAYNLPWEERMTTITLPADIEGPLAEEARRCGTTPERLALDTLRPRFAPPAASPSEEPPEPSLAGYAGLVEGSTEPLSERYGDRFAEGLAEKNDLEEWYRELRELGPAQYEPGEWDRVQATLADADELARAMVRRQMGLS
jgi:hypothetical protein